MEKMQEKQKSELAKKCSDARWALNELKDQIAALEKEVSFLENAGRPSTFPYVGLDRAFDDMWGAAGVAAYKLHSLLDYLYDGEA